MNSWMLITRDNLLKNEKERIILRAKCWQNIVNICTNTAMSKIQIDRINEIKAFLYSPSEAEINQISSYLLSWNGLNTKLINNTKQPKTMKDYELKSINWANGRRAKEYAKYFFPNMIESAQKYANSASKTLFNIYLKQLSQTITSNMYSKQKQCEILFADILIYSYLVKLCEEQVIARNGRRRVFLLCDNSIKRNKSNKTRKIFQKYAKDHDYNGQFPSHRQEAIDFFSLKMKNTFKSLFVILQGIKTVNIMNKNVVNTKQILDTMDYIATNCKTNDKNAVIIDKDAWNIIKSAAEQIEKNNIKNKQRIDELKQKIIKLESLNSNHNQLSHKQHKTETIMEIKCDSDHDQDDNHKGTEYSSYPQQIVSPALTCDMNMDYYDSIIPMNIDSDYYDYYNLQYDSDVNITYNII